MAPASSRSKPSACPSRTAAPAGRAWRSRRADVRSRRAARAIGRAAARLQSASIAIDLFAGIAVTDYAAAVEWYARLFGSAPAFVPNDTEAVWQLAEHRFVFIEQRPEHAGHARHLVFVEDLGAVIAQIAERGLEPAAQESYANGVCKAAYHDADGNEMGFGGGPPA